MDQLLSIVCQIYWTALNFCVVLDDMMCRRFGVTQVYLTGPITTGLVAGVRFDVSEAALLWGSDMVRAGVLGSDVLG